jgi:hypothetical protein
MSAEVISMILVAAGVLITLGGGFFAGLAWMIWRMDERFDKVDERFEKFDARFEKIDERLSQVRSELNDVKVAVARLEGPQPRLIFHADDPPPFLLRPASDNPHYVAL